MSPALIPIMSALSRGSPRMRAPRLAVRAAEPERTGEAKDDED